MIKNLLAIFLVLTVGCVAQTGVHDVKAANSDNGITRDLTVPSGRTLTIAPAGALVGNLTGNASGSSGSTTGNAATATVLQTARTINGVSFNGSANITVPVSVGLNANRVPYTASSGVLSGNTSNFTFDPVTFTLSTVKLRVGTNIDGLGLTGPTGSYLFLRPASNLTANRNLYLVPGDSDRVLTLTGDATLNQNVSTTGTPTFTSLTATTSATVGITSTQGVFDTGSISFTNVGGTTGSYGRNGLTIKAATGQPTLTIGVGSTTESVAITSSAGNPVLEVEFAKFENLAVRDTAAAFDLSIASTSSPALAANRSLTIDVSNANRILKLTGNTTLNQAVDTTASPTFTGATLTGTPLGAVSGGTGRGLGYWNNGDLAYYNGTAFTQIPGTVVGTPLLSINSFVPGWTSDLSVDSVAVSGFITSGGMKRMAADVTVTNSSTAADLTGLSVTLEAGQTYTFEAHLYSATTGATATCGMKAGVAASGGLTATDLRWGIVHNYSPAGNGPAGALSLSSTSNSFTTVGSDTVGLVNTVTVISGTITVNAGGTFTIQGAQNTAAASCTAIFRRGSWLEVKQY